MNNSINDVNDVDKKIFHRQIVHHAILERNRFSSLPQRKSEYRESLKCSISYAETLSLKWICTEDGDLRVHLKLYQKDLLREDIKRLKYEQLIRAVKLIKTKIT